jgi:hypothetical protein
MGSRVDESLQVRYGSLGLGGSGGGFEWAQDEFCFRVFTGFKERLGIQKAQFSIVTDQVLVLPTKDRRLGR